jgi:hypothetical protein
MPTLTGNSVGAVTSASSLRMGKRSRIFAFVPLVSGLLLPVGVNPAVGW